MPQKKYVTIQRKSHYLTTSVVLQAVIRYLRIMMLQSFPPFSGWGCLFNNEVKVLVKHKGRERFREDIEIFVNVLIFLFPLMTRLHSKDLCFGDQAVRVS